jgi:hypothetical protein
LTWLAALPVVGEAVPLSRFTGKDELARKVQQFARQVEQQTGQQPVLIAGHYQTAGWLAFYIDGQPVVYSAQHQLGGRKSSYDFFADTNLQAALAQPRPAVLVRNEPADWQRHFNWSNFEILARPDQGDGIFYAESLRLQNALGQSR